MFFEEDVELIFRVCIINTILNELYNYIPFRIYENDCYNNLKNGVIDKLDDIDLFLVNNINYSKFTLLIKMEDIIKKSTNTEHIDYLKNKKDIEINLYNLFNSTPFYNNIYNLFNELKINFPNILFEKYKEYINFSEISQ